MNYDSCPRAIEANIWWPRTRFGLPAAASCPKGSAGNETTFESVAVLHVGGGELDCHSN